MGMYQNALNKIDVEELFELVDGDMTYLPINRIGVKKDFNPRKEFLDEEMNELIEDVKKRGVIQPIIVRKNPDSDGQFWIIAGERRWRAATAASLKVIPVIFREVDEASAIAIAKSENAERSDMGVIGEAHAAREMLMNCGNDAEEAANQLNMTISTFNKRLMLLNAEPETQRALGRKEIKIGHAELLVGLPRAEQVDTVKAIIEKGMNNVSVADLKRSIGGFVMDLSKACFDKTECLDCVNNTTKQAGLFDEHVGESKCSNQKCFADKTIEAVSIIRDELSEKFGTVHLDIERSQDSYTFIEKVGDNGVGVEQFSACIGCSNFGAILSTKAGEEGQIKKGACFDLECYAKKVEANKKQPGQSKNEGKTSAKKSKGNSSASKGTSLTDQKKSKPSNETPKVVNQWIDRFLLDQAVAELSNFDDKVLELKANHVCQALTVAQMLSSHTISREVDKELLNQHKLCALSNNSQRLEVLIHMDEKELKELRNALAIAFLKTECGGSPEQVDGIRSSYKVLNYFSVDVRERFQIKEEFLKGHTTAGIMSLLQETSGLSVSFAKWKEGKEEGGFKKLMQKTKKQIIEEVTKTDFPFSGFLPRCIQQRIDKIK